jgi:hypothetical protein
MRPRLAVHAPVSLGETLAAEIERIETRLGEIEEIDGDGFTVNWQITWHTNPPASFEHRDRGHEDRRESGMLPTKSLALCSSRSKYTAAMRP